MRNDTFSQVLQSISASANQNWLVTIPENWRQGRTTYGGLSAALCLKAVQNDYESLPPLRSAQINFVGPAEGELSIKTTVMRRGKSVTFISAEMTSTKGLTTHAVFCFGQTREAKINQHFTNKPLVPGHSEAKEFFRKGKAPIFTENFDCLLAQGDRPISSSAEIEFHMWVRHKDRQAQDIVALLAIADMAPPAILPMFESFAPISSMTWMLNFLTDTPETTDGWWLLNSRAEHYVDGYSSQNMQLWNADKELIITGHQNIAGFY